LEHLPHPRAVLALRGMPQAEVAHLVEAARLHMLEEAAHKFMAAGLAFLIPEGDRSIIETDNAGIGEGDAKDIAGEVFEHRLFALTPGYNVEDP
jgi:hypothetical protein